VDFSFSEAEGYPCLTEVDHYMLRHPRYEALRSPAKPGGPCVGFRCRRYPKSITRTFHFPILPPCPGPAWSRSREISRTMNLDRVVCGFLRVRRPAPPRVTLFSNICADVTVMLWKGEVSGFNSGRLWISGMKSSVYDRDGKGPGI
jgi:hypothetical protein